MRSDADRLLHRRNAALLVHALQARGLGLLPISQATGLSRHTVRRARDRSGGPPHPRTVELLAQVAGIDPRCALRHPLDLPEVCWCLRCQETVVRVGAGRCPGCGYEYPAAPF